MGCLGTCRYCSEDFIIPVEKEINFYYDQTLLNGLDKLQTGFCLMCHMNQLHVVLTDFRAMGTYPDLWKVYDNTRQSTRQLSCIFVLYFHSNKSHTASWIMKTEEIIRPPQMKALGNCLMEGELPTIQH